MSDPHQSNNGLDLAQMRMGQRNALLAQAFGGVAYLSFTNGLLLVYFNGLRLPSATILLFLSLPLLIDAVLRLPFAFLSDFAGARTTGLYGAATQVLGFLTLVSAGWCQSPWLEWVIALGVILFAAGTSLHAAGWFSLMSHMSTSAQRGRFFGRVFFSWNLFGAAFASSYAFFLSEDSIISRFQLILGVIVLLLVGRIYFYRQLPDLSPAGRTPMRHPIQRIAAILRLPGFSSFIAYVFLLMLFSGSCPFVFGLIEKRVLGWGDDQVVWVGVQMALGSMLGFYLGGRIIDAFGTRKVFLFCHAGYACIILLFLLRSFYASETQVFIIGMLHLLFGMVYAASNISISTEMLALVTDTDKSISTSICQLLYLGGAAMSGLLCTGALKSGMFSEQWRLVGHTMHQYDALLLIAFIMIALLVVTLGLVPSVLGRVAWIPRG